MVLSVCPCLLWVVEPSSQEKEKVRELGEEREIVLAQSVLQGVEVAVGDAPRMGGGFQLALLPRVSCALGVIKVPRCINQIMMGQVRLGLSIVHVV